MSPERRRVLARLRRGPKIPQAVIEAARSGAGGWTRETLAGWGVPWPPPKGWRKAIEARDVTSAKVSPRRYPKPKRRYQLELLGAARLRDMLTPRVTGLNNVIPPPGDAARPPWEDGA